jgi:hypothetical protein
MPSGGWGWGWEGRGLEENLLSCRIGNIGILDRYEMGIGQLIEPSGGTVKTCKNRIFK